MIIVDAKPLGLKKEDEIEGDVEDVAILGPVKKEEEIEGDDVQVDVLKELKWHLGYTLLAYFVYIAVDCSNSR